MEKSDCFSLIDENDSLISPDADDAADLTHLHSGFLDADEISTIIDGAEKGKKQLLPGIDEDISRSSESISTLASDNLALESLENELFKDIRASIQKSSISASNRKAAPKETDKLVKRSVKKEDITSRNGIATNVTSIRQSRGMLGSARISKKDSSSALVKQAGFRNGKSSSSLPQLPKVIPKPEAMPAVTTKRAVLGANRIKTETNKSKVGGKVQVHVPVTTGLDNPRRSVSRPASLQKAPGLASSNAAKKEVGRSSSSSNNSNSTFTEKIQKSTSISGTTKKPSKPIIQASSKIPLSRKAPSKSGLPATLTSSKISSSISPSSSISEWSSASSRTSIDTNSSRRSMDSETPSIMCSDVQSNDGILDGILNQFKESPSQDMKINNAQTKVVSRSLMMKPSGLRMPSPKIGFFDGAKSMVHTPNACRESQLRVPTGLPKIGAAIRSPVGRSKKAEGNMPSGKKTISGANTVLNTIKSASPRPSQESSRASMEGHGDSKSVSSLNISSEVGSSNKGTGKPWLEMTSTKIELPGQQSNSPKAFQESASSGMSSEQTQLHLPAGLPKIIAGIQSSSPSSKIEGSILAGKKATAGANTVLDTPNAADPEPLRALTMKVHGNHRSSLGPDISSEARSLDEGTGKLWSKMTLTSINTEVESQNLNSLKPFQGSASVGLSPEKSQSCLPIVLPNTEALISNPVGSSKKEEKIMTGEKATSIAIAVLDTSIPASPTPSQESSRDMTCHGDSKSVSSPNLSSGIRSFNKGTGKPWPEMTFASANIEFEDQNSDSAVPFPESAFSGLSQEQSQSHLPICSPKLRAAIDSPVGSSKKAEGKIPTSEKTTEGANAVLYESESAASEASQELSRDSVKDHGKHRNLVSMGISSEVTSTNIELEGQISDPSKLGQDNASFGMSPEQQLCLPTCLPKTGASIHSPVGKKAEGAIAVLDKSESATPEQSQELSRELMDHGDHINIVSIDISSEMTSSDDVTREPCSEMISTITNKELEGQKVDSPKLSHESASFGMSPEHQSCLSTGSPKIKAPRHSPVGILKKAEGNTPTGTQTTEGANTVLDKSESATPETLQESTGELMKGLGDHRSVLSVDISSEVTNSVEAARNPCSEIKLASTKSELESQKADSPQLFHESASFGMSPGQPTGLPKIRNAIHSPVGSSKKAEGRSPVGTKTPEGANTALEKLESATSELSQESTGDLMKDHGNHRSLLSLDISSEVMSSVEVTRIPCSEMALTSTNIELEGQNSYFPEPFQKNGFGLSPEQELCLPTGLPKTGAASCNTVGSLKKGEFLAGEKATVGATVLHTPKPTPEPSQESLSALMEGNGDPWKLNTNESSEARSPNMGSGKPWSKITLTSTNIELEGQKADSPVPFGQSASPGVSPEILSETDRSNCGMAEDVKIRKHQSAEWANMSDEENNENLLFII
uniref:Uncharacterized protein n=1 Tax=Daucus carota subsp. sativus TaxID=79200 RepID=A0A165WUH5_DAUCS